MTETQELERLHIEGPPKAEDDDRRYITILEASKIAGVTRQALHKAIQINRLPAIRYKRTYKVKVGDVKRYVASKYKLKLNRIPADQRNYLSVAESAHYMTHVLQYEYTNTMLYYHINRGHIPVFRKRGVIYIDKEEIKRFVLSQ